MSDGAWAVVLLNRATVEAPIHLSLAELGFSTPWWKRIFGIFGIGGRHQVRDLWSRETAEVKGDLVRTVPAHGAVMLRIN